MTGNAGRSDAGKEVVDLRLGAAEEERTNLENHSSFSEAIKGGGRCFTVKFAPQLPTPSYLFTPKSKT